MSWLAYYVCAFLPEWKFTKISLKPTGHVDVCVYRFPISWCQHYSLYRHPYFHFDSNNSKRLKTNDGKIIVVYNRNILIYELLLLNVWLIMLLEWLCFLRSYLLFISVLLLCNYVLGCVLNLSQTSVQSVRLNCNNSRKM